MAGKKRIPTRHYVESFNLPGSVTNFVCNEANKAERSASSQLAYYLKGIMRNHDAFIMLINNSTINSNNTTNSHNTNKEKSIENIHVDEGASVSINISDNPKPRKK